MKIHYALYDQSVFTDGDYWTWSASEIRELLSKFYTDVAKKHLPPKPMLPNPNCLQDDDLWGGLVRFADWTVVYRYFSVGYDHKDRPGHSILLTAWVSSADAEQVDLLPILTNDTFSHVLENARKRPVPRPFALKENWTSEKITPSSFQDGETAFNDLTEALRAFAAVPSDRKAEIEIADVKIIKTAKERKFILHVNTESKPEVLIKTTPAPKLVASDKTDEPTKTIKSAKHNNTANMFRKLFYPVATLLIVVLVLVAVFDKFGGNNSDHSLQPNNGSQISTTPLQTQQQEQIEQFKKMFSQLPSAERFALIQALQIEHEKLNNNASHIDGESRSMPPSPPQPLANPPEPQRNTHRSFSPLGG